jgi:hypothetical protein
MQIEAHGWPEDFKCNDPDFVIGATAKAILAMQ